MFFNCGKHKWEEKCCNCWIADSNWGRRRWEWGSPELPSCHQPAASVLVKERGLVAPSSSWPLFHLASLLCYYNKLASQLDSWVRIKEDCGKPHEQKLKHDTTTCTCVVQSPPNRTKIQKEPAPCKACTLLGNGAVFCWQKRPPLIS